MKRLITIILTTILVIPAFAAEDVRDLLVQKFEQTGAASFFKAGERWVSLPDYENRVGWNEVLGEYALQYINAGEKYLDYVWQTDYHNLPLINGTAQVYGSEFRSKNASVKGKVMVVNMGKAALLKFPQGMTPSVETINLNDPRLSNVWGDSIRRISFRTADNAPTKGSYVFNITELY